MKPTQDYVIKTFDAFNRQIFAGRLQPVPVAMTHVRSYLGACVFKRKRLPGGGVKKFDFRLRINADAELSPAQWEDVILHEMIHYYIDSKGLHDTSAHGPLFRRMMDDINTRYGRHIDISHRTAPGTLPPARQRAGRWHVVARLSMADGRKAVKVLPRIVQRIVGFDRALKQAPDVKGAEYFLTCNPFFDAYPNSTALRVHFVDAPEFERQLQGARRLTVSGDRVDMEHA